VRSSVPSSVAVIGVGMSLLGASMSVLEGLLWVSVGVCARVGESRGGVGCCIGTSGAELALLSLAEFRASFNSCVVVVRMRDSSGGQVVRPVMLSCSTDGETIVASSGVGIVRVGV
jgi:hypothetical protein